MRYTLAMPISNSSAIASRVLPARASRSTSAALRCAVGARPLYLPSAAALAMPSRWRSNIKSRSNAAMAPSMVSISLPVGLRVSIRWPPIESTTRAMPRFSISSTMSNRLRVERASRSGLVTISTSPSRTNSSAAVSLARSATEDTCSAKIFSQPAAFRSRRCAARPADCSTVLVRAYPTNIAHVLSHELNTL